MKKQKINLKFISFVALVTFYIVAGLNHFRDPQFYLPLIPDYLSRFDVGINILAGLFEVGFALALLFEKTRKWAVYGIVLMLVAFIPSHIWFIDIGGCVPDGLCVHPWVPGIRLLLVHPLFMLWAWWHRKEPTLSLT